MFGASVGQRVHHITSRHNRHLWRLLYEKTGLLLDITILLLQIFSKELSCCCLSACTVLTYLSFCLTQPAVTLICRQWHLPNMFLTLICICGLKPLAFCFVHGITFILLLTKNPKTHHKVTQLVFEPAKKRRWRWPQCVAWLLCRHVCLCSLCHGSSRAPGQLDA